MISTFRGKWAAWMVGGIIGLIAFVFVFEGVFNGVTGRGMGTTSGPIAGEVNGETISITEFNRAVERRTEFMKGMMGGEISEEQMKMFRIREGTFQELVQQKLLAQAAKKAGLEPSDEQVRAEIMKLPYFQKDGQFDVAAYKNVLVANNMTPASFEKVMREQLSVDGFTKSISSQVQVSPEEVKEEYLGTQEQRNIKYVSLPAQAGKKGDLTPKELADKIAGSLKAGTSGDAAINAWIKPYGGELKSTQMISKNAGFVPGIGENAAFFNEVFSNSSNLRTQAKVYEISGRYIVALVIDAKKADLAQFEKEKEKTYAQVKSKKDRQMMESLMKKLMEKSKDSIRPNPSVVGGMDSEQS